MTEKLNKTELIRILIERDGLLCAFPGCEKPFTVKDPPTIDHWFPRFLGGTWDIDNLKLMHATCNSRKGSIVPNEDGTLNIPPEKNKFPKLERPMQCALCNTGRNLEADQICPLCGREPQPPRWPKYAQRKPKECLHDGTTHCWMCVLFPESVK